MRIFVRFLMGCLTLVLAWSPLPAQAESASVGAGAEAWYQTACSGVACSPGLPSVNPYPADTLHVGVTAGREDSRTYIRFDTTWLPPDASVVGGTLLAAVSPDSGTRSADIAKLRVCLATERFTDEEGSIDPAPSVNCQASASGVYRPGSDRNVFAFSLAPFTDRLSGGGDDWGIALMPEEAAQSDSWHVSFDGRKRPGGIPMVAMMTYEIATSGTGGSEVQILGELPEGDFLHELRAPSIPVPTDPFLPVPSAGEAASVAERLEQSPSPLSTDDFRYPVVLLLPLALAGIGGILARTLTQPIPPFRETAL